MDLIAVQTWKGVTGLRLHDRFEAIPSYHLWQIQGANKQYNIDFTSYQC